jgi:hypothetical protein
MVGIWAKIKNGFNWVKDHIFKPVVNGVRKVLDNKVVKNLFNFGAPLLNTVIPGLGTGIQTGYNVLTKVAPMAQQLMSDHDKGGAKGIAQKALSGGYTKSLHQIPGVPRMIQRLNPNVQDLLKSLNLAKNPNQLNPLITLKKEPQALMPYRENEDELPQAVTPSIRPSYRGVSRVEELD